jgi:ppGpp synthetase/RelA/SpoT-type nucleotidyltranferase
MAEGKASLEDRLVINDWRTSHALPLNVVYMALKRLGSATDVSAIFSQRIKRLPSVEIKFHRNPKMKLTRMQDLGVCRVVLQEDSLIRELRKRYKESRIITHELVRDYDYLAEPKPYGYRGAHLIFNIQVRVRPNMMVSLSNCKFERVFSTAGQWPSKRSTTFLIKD